MHSEPHTAPHSDPAAQVTFLPAAWASHLTLDILDAQTSITLSALSMLHPHTNAPGPWPDLWRALISARSRGRSVHIYLAQAQLAHPATRQNPTTAAYAHTLRFNVHLVPGPRLLHAKSCIIDQRVLWIGSGNFTAAACGPNHEFYVRIISPPLANAALEALQSTTLPT
jgi:phosphatidylserine/phosphatidylglycerophosphate/cardiolipin synthase-like enzyme